MSFKSNKVLSIITNMMLEENDDHAVLLEKIKNRYPPPNDHLTNGIRELFEHLNLIHNIRIGLLEQIYSKIKDIK